MGWTGHTYDRRPAVDIVREELVGSGERYKAVANSGAKYWVIQNTTTSERIAVVVLTRRSHGDLYTKVVDESMGPYDYNFPLRLLNMLGEPLGELSAEWREKVREHHAAKKATPKLETGTTVVFDRPLEFTNGVGSHDRLTYLGKYSFRTPTGVRVRLFKQWKTKLNWTVLAENEV
jgi:hypothetical protein